MPWKVAKDSRCPANKPWAVTNAQTGRVAGCHPDRASAVKQQKALYVNVPESRA